MKVSKLYAEFIIKFPKFKNECVVVIDYANKFFLVYFGRELSDKEFADQYASLRERFKIGDDYTCRHYNLFPTESIDPKCDIYDMINLRNIDSELPALKELSESMYNNFNKHLGKEVDSHE